MTQSDKCGNPARICARLGRESLVIGSSGDLLDYAMGSALSTLEDVLRIETMSSLVGLVGDARAISPHKGKSSMCVSDIL